MPSGVHFRSFCDHFEGPDGDLDPIFDHFACPDGHLEPHLRPFVPIFTTAISRVLSSAVADLGVSQLDIAYMHVIN